MARAICSRGPSDAKGAIRTTVIRFWQWGLPAFGRSIGVIVNYTPDRAIRFDPDGNALEILSRAHRPADAYVAIRGRLMQRDTLRAIMRIEL